MRQKYATAATIGRKTAAWLERLTGSPGRAPLPSLSTSTLVLVDPQRLFLDPASPAFLPVWPAVEPRARALLGAFRTMRRPVVWTRHVDAGATCGTVIGHFGGSPLRRSDRITRFASGWQPGRGEAIIEKSRYSAWAATSLHRVVRATGPIVLAGVTTHRCILATAVDWASRDRICVVAADACATSTESLHLETLDVLSNGMCHVATVAEITAALCRKPAIGSRRSAVGQGVR